MFMERWAEITLLLFGGIFSLVTVGLLGAIAFALSKMVGLLNTATEKLDPVIVKATGVIETVQRVTTNVGEKADQILTKGETLTDDVSERVEKTAGVVQSAVTGPLINLSSLIAGVTKGFSVYSHPHPDNGAKQSDNGAKQYETKK